MPKPLTITVGYTIGIKRNLGDFSNANLQLDESETWDVSDIEDETAVELLASTIHDRLRAKLDARAEEQDRKWR